MSSHGLLWRTAPVQILVAALTIVGCREAKEVSAPRLNAVGMRTSLSAVASADAWDTFVADVTITIDPGSRSLSARRTPAPGPAHVNYHLERALGADGNWKTTTTFDPLSLAPAASANPRYQLARVEDDGDGSPPRRYNASGELMDLSS